MIFCHRFSIYVNHKRFLILVSKIHYDIHLDEIIELLFVRKRLFVSPWFRDLMVLGYCPYILW